MKILVEDASKRDDVIGNTNKQNPDFPRIISTLNTDQKTRNSLSPLQLDMKFFEKSVLIIKDTIIIKYCK